MDDQTNSNRYGYQEKRKSRGGASGGIYGLAFLGAVFYYLHHATTFVAGLIGILKAIVWPAILVYYVMDYLKM